MTAPRTAVVARGPVTTALIEMIAAATARPCGDHEAPPGASLDEGYTIVYALEGGSFEGAPLWAPEADGILPYQITSASSLRSGAEWIADRVRLTLTSRASGGGYQVPFPVLVGAAVTHREPDGSAPGAIMEGPPGKRVFNIPDRYRLHVVST